MAVTLICGHLHPDTDSVVSALAAEELFSRQGEHVLAVRGGPLNPETSWILDRFKTEVPPEIRDVRVQVRDLDYDKIEPLRHDMPLWQAWETLDASHNRAVPIVDEDGRLTGIMSAGAFASLLYTNDISVPKKINSRLLLQTIKGRCSGTLPESLTIPFAWSGRSAQPIQEGALVFAELLVEEQISRAVKAKAMGFCMCYISDEEGDLLRLKWEKRFSEEGMVLITTPLDPYSALNKAMLSLPLKDVLEHNKLIAFHENDALDDVRQSMLSSRHRSYPVLDAHDHVLGMVSRYHLLQPQRKKVILVDHNERSQAVRGLDQAEIKGIIDHHRLGDIQTSGPILFRNETVGCTATIIAKMFREAGLQPSPRTAGMMCCAILSDTVQFKSPTCTRQDIEAANWLAELAGEDAALLGEEMYSRSHQLKNKTPEELLFMDFKEFFFGEIKVGVSQVSVMNLKELDSVLGNMAATMKEILAKQRFDLLLFMATDIKNEGTWLYYAGSHIKELSDAFDVELTGDHGHFFLPKLMSRKKQLIPALGEAFQ